MHIVQSHQYFNLISGINNISYTNDIESQINNFNSNNNSNFLNNPDMMNDNVEDTFHSNFDVPDTDINFDNDSAVMISENQDSDNENQDSDNENQDSDNENQDSIMKTKTR